MVTDPLDDWKTQAEAAEILRCSQKTVGRMAAQKKIQRVLRRVPGRKPMPVFNPDDIEAIRAEMVQVEPFPVKERGKGKALARLPSQGGVDLLAQLRGGPHRLDHLAAFLRWTPQFLLPPVREILRGGEPEGKVPLRMFFQASVHLLRRRPSVRRVRSLAVV